MRRPPGFSALGRAMRGTCAPRPGCARATARRHGMLKFIGGTIGVIFIIGLLVVIGILSLIF